jgi:uncharacterized protein
MPQQRPPRTLGSNDDVFWNWCEQRQLRLQRCHSCGELNWPVVQSCEHCQSSSLSWERMSGRGLIVSKCTFERDYYNGMLPMPWETILVELEEGILFVSNPLSGAAEHLQTGDRVEIEFIRCEDTTGEFNLPVLRKLQQR